MLDVTAEGRAKHLLHEFGDAQLKARLEGIPTPVYGRQEAHHLS